MKRTLTTASLIAVTLALALAGRTAGAATVGWSAFAMISPDGGTVYSQYVPGTGSVGVVHTGPGMYVDEQNML